MARRVSRRKRTKRKTIKRKRGKGLFSNPFGLFQGHISPFDNPLVHPTITYNGHGLYRGRGGRNEPVFPLPSVTPKDARRTILAHKLFNAVKQVRQHPNKPLLRNTLFKAILHSQ